MDRKTFTHQMRPIFYKIESSVSLHVPVCQRHYSEKFHTDERGNQKANDSHG